jgi:hypothetical protein
MPEPSHPKAGNADSVPDTRGGIGSMDGGDARGTAQRGSPASGTQEAGNPAG